MLYIDQYFATARERYRIMLEKNAGKPKPWTTDTTFQDWRFCNVHREDDKTTKWFRDNVRDPLQQCDPLAQVEAAIIFRWFNRIETGEKIKDLLLDGWNTQEACRRLTGVAPLVTGAYIIKAGDYCTKLEGILDCIDAARLVLPHKVKTWGPSLHDAWESLLEIPYMGRFMAYEAISDIRWTPVLNQAADIMTWANAGPGCARGLGRALNGDLAHFNAGSKADQRHMQDLMRKIVGYSTMDDFWPQEWRPWEMREAEHWACEYDKYMRVQGGERMKQKYPGK